ncbi:response regulator transcription factor [Campylobacter insulaenigrae]|uniref:Two-component system response regulator n=2 Tax=Campylobacter insulaenigrae TaxID=260714 RepID=A0A0A8H4A9_9BACT|nr:response regulator transcription factor [Campylobacter insulaenigrae]AJC87749.1 two-component system response regulator [Campylobacter insulaenigrae NCTC 12927]MCR6571306.1 response regulator transcription factor [Campylobacter insulaenigrae]MCR6571840.1 response regulator transcription factor [Campylobacter insulaenigrae]MCR6574627.1 response regulator transcription factor [Campylobacter insulaenigrae]MCR6576029.1 response regulator transcription factor [Campylobacter insulaenigrae]
MLNLVLIEDDKDLNELLCFRLKQENINVFSFFDFLNLENFLDKNDIDLIIMDRNLPSGDSIEMIKKMRKKGYDENVIFLSAKTLQKDILDGFEQGCDDYICKPFDFNELLFRIKAVTKRNKLQKEEIICGDFILYFEERILSYKNENINLSTLDVELLKCFFIHKNQLLNRQFLSEQVWKNDNTSDKTINTAIVRLKQKIPQIKEKIIAVRSVGYKFC